MSGLRRWLFAAAGTAALVVLLIGALISGAPGSPAPVPATPTPAPPVTASPTQAASPTPTAVPTTAATVPLRAWFARDQLPPIAATIQTSGGSGADGRITARVLALMRGTAQTPPAGATNPAALIRPHTTTGGGGITQTAIGLSVRIEGDLATVEFDIEDWGVRGAAITDGLVQQLVYTITEEPGITRARIVEKGKTTATIDQLVLDKPLTREDVSGYAFDGSSVTSIGMVGDVGFVSQDIEAWSYSNDPVGTFGRLSLEVQAFSPPLEGGAAPAPQRIIPTFRAELSRATAGGKWQIALKLPSVRSSPAAVSVRNAAAGPILSVEREVDPQSVTLRILLDDARPWRISVEPSGPRTVRINVDVGGRPEWVNKNIAVYSIEPKAGGGGMTVRGAARVFEANVSWRVKDAAGQVVARGNTTATVGTSEVWGTFELTAASAATGPATLEVYWASPRDGSEQDVIAIPLGVR